MRTAEPKDPFSRVVEQIEGEVGRFHVRSRSRPGIKHLVDVLEGPFGQCSCEDQAFSRNKKLMSALAKGEVKLSGFCWHLKMTWGWLGYQVAKQLRKQRDQQESGR